MTDLRIDWDTMSDEEIDQILDEADAAVDQRDINELIKQAMKAGK